MHTVVNATTQLKRFFIVITLLIYCPTFLILHGCELAPEDQENLEQEAVPVQILVANHNVTLMIGDTMQVSFTIKPDTIPVTDIEWSSENTNVATVSNTGLIIAKTIGETKVKISSAEKKAETTLIVSVVPIPVQHVFLDAEVIAAYINQPKKLNVVFEPHNATDQSITWKSSDNTIASIDQTGTVTAKKPGYAWVSANHNTIAFDNAVIVPANENQLFAASQINSSGQKHYINVYIVALEKAVTVKQVVLYRGSKGDPNAYVVRTVNPALTLNPGEGKEIKIEVTSDESNDLSFGRYLQFDVTIEQQEYVAYLSWFNNFESEAK